MPVGLGACACKVRAFRGPILRARQCPQPLAMGFVVQWTGLPGAPNGDGTVAVDEQGLLVFRARGASAPLATLSPKTDVARECG